MDRKHIFPVILIPLIFCIFFTFLLHTGESASINTTLDAKYTRTDSSQTGRKNEYNPRLSVKYSHPLTLWTDLSGEVKFDYKKEDKRPEEDSETREPQIELRLKSLIYDLKTGFKETRNQNQPTETRAFGHLLIQPSNLPELRVDYDHDETKNQSKKDEFTLGTIYKPSKILRIKLNFKHEYMNYITSTSDDTEDLNLSGEIKFNHTLSTRRPIKVEISYKAEDLYRENKKELPEVEKDELLQTLRGKLSYKPTKKTDMSLEYDNKTSDDRKKDGEDNSDQDIQFDISQKLADWLKATGRIRKESKEEEERREGQGPGILTINTEKITLQGHVRAVPTDWLQLNLKVIDEESEKTDPNSLPDKRDKTIIEASLRSDFPNFLRSYQTLDFKRVNEDKKEAPFSEEERFMWKWSLSPIDDLSLKPEYIHSVTKRIEDEGLNDITNGIAKDITNEYKLSFAYNFSVYDIWTVNLSHVTSRKEVEIQSKDPNIPSSSHTETNHDSSLEGDFQPYESLFITFQITRKDYRISDERPSEEKSYSLKIDWSFTPFTWSTSYKYDDKKQQNDTETFESKILCDFSDYTIEGEYKFTQTFRVPKDKEDIVTLRFKAFF